jgi:lipopolysaccharide biosynthesis regulator YciM
MKRKTAAKFTSGAMYLVIALFFSGCGEEQEDRNKAREYRSLVNELKGVFVKEVQMVYEIDSEKAIDKFYEMSEEEKDKAIERLRKTIEEEREALRTKPFRGGLLMRWINSERRKASKSGKEDKPR